LIDIRIPILLTCCIWKNHFLPIKRALIFSCRSGIVQEHMLTLNRRKNENHARRVFWPNEETVLYFKSESPIKEAVPRYACVLKTVNRLSSNLQIWNLQQDSHPLLQTLCSLFFQSWTEKPLEERRNWQFCTPNETVILEVFVPQFHPSRVSGAMALSKLNFWRKFLECKNFWQNKLQKGAQYMCPNNVFWWNDQGSILHLGSGYLYGNEPSRVPLTPCYWGVFTYRKESSQ